jgi:hypothetical protein
MTTAAVRTSGIRRLSAARRIVVFIAALAFALQSYIAQTHFHGLPESMGGGVSIAVPHAPATPLDHRTADCPFCQAVIHAGVFITPTTLLLHLPFAWTKTAALVFTGPAASDATAHDWHSRAPPRL